MPGATRTLPAELPPSLAAYPGYLLSFITEHTRERFERTLLPWGIDGRQASVLVLIDAEGPMSQTELGRRLHIDKSPLVGVIDGLEERGYVTRRRADHDRRVQTIHLLPPGRAALTDVRAAGDADAAEHFAVLDEDEQAQLHDLLLRVAEGVARG